MAWLKSCFLVGNHCADWLSNLNHSRNNSFLGGALSAQCHGHMEKYRVQHCFFWYQHYLPAKQQVSGPWHQSHSAKMKASAGKQGVGSPGIFVVQLLSFAKNSSFKAHLTSPAVRRLFILWNVFLKMTGNLCSSVQGEKKKKKNSSPPKTTPVLKKKWSLRSQVRVMRGR